MGSLKMSRNIKIPARLLKLILMCTLRIKILSRVLLVLLTGLLFVPLGKSPKSVPVIVPVIITMSQRVVFMCCVVTRYVGHFSEMGGTHTHTHTCFSFVKNRVQLNTTLINGIIYAIRQEHLRPNPHCHLLPDSYFLLCYCVTVCFCLKFWERQWR